jgi:hypothetical protein
MTTSRSPLSALRRQADTIAVALKQAERGEKIVHDPVGKIAAARCRESVKFAVVMDDKIISVEMPWAMIHDTSERGISEYILKQMKGARDAVH